MAKTYLCQMKEICEFTLKADNEEEALWWIQTHSIRDVYSETSGYSIDYVDDILQEIDGSADIDISTEEVDSGVQTENKGCV